MPSAPSSSENSRNGSYHLAKILAVNVLLPMLLAILVYIAIGPEIEEHDVFVSFRGADARNSFLSRLRKALREKSIKAFIDDQIIGGDLTMPRLFDAIDDSKVAVIIFSKHFPFSEDCLDEFTKIVECHAHRQTCIPIFYNVSTSDLMQQSEDFEEALVAHEKNFKQLDKVARWKKAMTNITNHRRVVSSVTKSEVEFIEELMEHISLNLKQMSAKYRTRRWWLPYFLPPLLIFVSMAVTSHFIQQQQAEEHDVFVNYYGEVTLFEELSKELKEAQIKSFNNRKHAGGEHMTKTIEKAIEESKVAVIIFSAGYAYSACCLEELVKILDCHKSHGLALVPMFYRVKGRDLKKPETFFEEAFSMHMERGRKVKRWQQAVKEAASDASLNPLRQQPNRKKGKDELSNIPEIVTAVKEKLKNKSSAEVQKDPVSYAYRLCLTVGSFLVSLLVLILSNEMLTQSLMGGEIIRKTQCIPL